VGIPKVLKKIFCDGHPLLAHHNKKSKFGLDPKTKISLIEMMVQFNGLIDPKNPKQTSVKKAISSFWTSWLQHCYCDWGDLFFTKIVIDHLFVAIVTRVVFFNGQQMDHLTNHIPTKLKSYKFIIKNHILWWVGR